MLYLIFKGNWSVIVLNVFVYFAISYTDSINILTTMY